MKKRSFYSFFIYIACFPVICNFFITPVEAAGKNGTRSIIITGMDINAGWYVDTKNQGYGFLGIGLDHNINSSRSLTAKIIAGYLNYQYESGPATIKAKVPELKLFIGEKFFYRQSYLTLTAGIVKRNTSFSPDDKSNSTGGSKTGFIFETNYNKDLYKRLIMDLLGDYNTIGRSLWGRGKLKYLLPSKTIKNKFFIGIEGIGEGNSDYSAYRIGPTFEIQKTKQNISVLFSTGYRHSNSISSSGYFNIELYHMF